MTGLATRSPAEPELPLGPATQAFDEMVTGDGRVRPHWQPLLAVLGHLPGRGLAARDERLRQLIDDDGIDLAAFGDGRETGTGGTAAWALDLVPLILADAEWRTLEAGLIRRARKLELVLQDLYGPQRLLAAGVWPPALVQASPDFLRPLRGTPPDLSLYAADLTRGPDGVWRVLADRTDGPGGAGYALNNRRLMARALPEAFRANQVRRLKPFFDLWGAALAEGLPDSARRVALLTQGAGGRTFYEHIYLARELDLPLVQPDDLTLREGRVHLKTLAGLTELGGLLRRVDGRLCDPLELAPEGAFGLAGLVDAARQGTVAIRNGLGAALLEGPATLTRLPAAGRFFGLGEPGLAPVETLWCGDAASLCDAEGRASDLVFTTLDGRAPIAAASLTAERRATLMDRVRAEPWRWVARPRIEHARAPSWGNGQLEPRPVVLRCFVLRNRGEWVAMPGGLARIADPSDPFAAALRPAGVSKDVWVLTAERRDAAVPATSVARLRVARPADDLPSRVADGLFWLGRYTERLEGALRLNRAALMRLAGGSLSPRDGVELALLLAGLEWAGLIDGGTARSPPDGLGVAAALTTPALPGRPLAAAFEAVRVRAERLRERFSSEMWGALSAVAEHRALIAAASGDVDRTLVELDAGLRALAAVAGLSAENMTRGGGWRFLEIGRRLERAQTVLGLTHLWVAVPLPGPDPSAPVDSPAGPALAPIPEPVSGGAAPAVRDAAGLDAALRVLLELMDSTLTYRRRYLAAPQPVPVLDLILADEANPRALAFQLAALATQVAALPGRPGADPAAPCRRALLALPREIARLDMAADAAPDPAFLSFLEAEGAALAALSDTLTRIYFSHVAEPQLVGASRAEGVGASQELDRMRV